MKIGKLILIVLGLLYNLSSMLQNYMSNREEHNLHIVSLFDSKQIQNLNKNQQGKISYMIH